MHRHFRELPWLFADYQRPSVQALRPGNPQKTDEFVLVPCRAVTLFIIGGGIVTHNDKATIFNNPVEQSGAGCSQAVQPQRVWSYTSCIPYGVQQPVISILHLLDLRFLAPVNEQTAMRENFTFALSSELQVVL